MHAWAQISCTAMDVMAAQRCWGPKRVREADLSVLPSQILRDRQLRHVSIEKDEA